MIVCCYFRVRYPLKYSELLLRSTEQQEDTSAKVHRIKSFWKNNMVGTEFESLLAAAKSKDHDRLKQLIGHFNFGAEKYEKKQLVQVWWLGDSDSKPGWYDATVESVNPDGSYGIKYTLDKQTVTAHPTLVPTSHTSRTPAHAHTYQPLVLSQETISRGMRIRPKVYFPPPPP